MATKVKLIEFGSASSFGLPFCKTLNDNTQTSSPFGLLSCSKAQKSTSSLGASPTKSTTASSPFHMQVKNSGEEKEVNSPIMSNRKGKLLEELEAMNGQ